MTLNVELEVKLSKKKRVVCGHWKLEWRRNEQEELLLADLLGARPEVSHCQQEAKSGRQRGEKQAEGRLVGRSRLPLQFRKASRPGLDCN